MAYIPNAKDVEQYEFSQTLQDFKAIAAHVETVDLREYQDPELLYTTLQQYDLIWVGGGNTYYLRWVVRKAGFEQIIRKLLQEGKVYGGSSAGSILAGPTLRHFDLMDEPDKAPELIWEGLHLTDLAVIPHWGREGYAPELMREVRSRFENDEFSFQVLRDDQAVIVANNEWRIVE